MENEDPLGCHVFDFVVDVTCLTSTYSESHRTLMLCGSIGTLCSCAVSKAVGKWGSREWQTHILHTSPPLTCTSHVPIGLHPLNTSSKIKLSRLSRQTDSSGRTLYQAQSPSACRALCDCMGHTPMKAALRTEQKKCREPRSLRHRWAAKTNYLQTFS